MQLPNATDEPLVVCLASRKLGADWKPHDVWRESATQMKARRALTEGAPASCVTFYNEFMNAVLTHLFGAELDRAGELDPRSLREGIFGRCRAAHGVTEAQGRGHLHMHVLLWTVHGPVFFARFLHDDDKRERLIRRINALVTAQLAKDGKMTNRHPQVQTSAPFGSAPGVTASVGQPHHRRRGSSARNPSFSSSGGVEPRKPFP